MPKVPKIDRQIVVIWNWKEMNVHTRRYIQYSRYLILRYQIQNLVIAGYGKRRLDSGISQFSIDLQKFGWAV